METTANLLSQSHQPPTPNTDEATRITASAESFFAALAKHYGVSFYKNLGASMEPALADGDTVAVKPLGNDGIQRWEIILFKFPLDPSRDFLKRVVALPGDTVEVRGEAILVNGAPVPGDTYALMPPNYTYGPKTVPTDSYFVLGDNRRNSYDSHAWGNTCPAQQECDFVPRANILGVLPADTKGCKNSGS